MRTIFALLALLLCGDAALAQDQRAFAPIGQTATVSLAVTGTTGRVQVQTSGTAANVRVFNSGAVPVFVACGDVTVVASLTTSMPIAPGTVEIIGCGQQYIAGISGGTGAAVYLTPGNGM